MAALIYLTVHPDSLNDISDISVIQEYYDSTLSSSDTINILKSLPKQHLKVLIALYIWTVRKHQICKNRGVQQELSLQIGILKVNKFYVLISDNKNVIRQKSTSCPFYDCNFWPS